MAYERKDYSGTPAETTLSAGINNSVTSISITSATGWPDGTNGPFFAVIDPGTASEEKVLVTTRTTTTLNDVTRAQDDTSAASHNSGATIYPCFTAVDADEANYWVAELSGAYDTAGDIAVADANNSIATLVKGANSTVLQVSAGGTLQYGTVTSAMIAAATIVAADIANDAIDSQHYADGSIDTAHIADAQITVGKMAANSVDSDQYVDGSIDTIHIGDLQVTTGKIAADAVTGAKIADDAVDSEHYVDGSIDTAHLADAQVTAAKIAAAVAGAGLTGGAGLALAVGAGTGITVNADDVAINQTVVNTGAAGTWTVALHGTSAAIGNGTVTARFIRTGRLITCWVRILIGTTTVIASDALGVSLPVAAFDPGDIRLAVGSALYRDGSSGRPTHAGDIYIDHAADTSNDRVRLTADINFLDVSLTNPVKNDTPFTWATDDEIILNWSYEAAA